MRRFSFPCLFVVVTLLVGAPREAAAGPYVFLRTLEVLPQEARMARAIAAAEELERLRRLSSAEKLLVARYREQLRVDPLSDEAYAAALELERLAAEKRKLPVPRQRTSYQRTIDDFLRAEPVDELLTCDGYALVVAEVVMEVSSVTDFAREYFPAEIVADLPLASERQAADGLVRSLARRGWLGDLPELLSIWNPRARERFPSTAPRWVCAP